MRRFLPSLSALHAFDASVRHLSFTKAAEDLGITQSGISRQIRNLEDFLGMVLFERAGSKLVLTTDGASYYEEIAALLNRLEEVSIDAVRGVKVHTMLKIGFHPTLMRRWGAGVMSRFAAAHPSAWFEVHPHGYHDTLDKTDLDIAFLRGTGNWDGVRSQLLFPEELVVVGAPHLIPPKGLPCEEALLDLPLIQNSARPSLWLHWLRGGGVHYKSRIQGPRLPTIDMIVECAVQGLGLAVVPRNFVTQELQTGTLVMALPRTQTTGEGIYVCYPHARISSSKVQLFREWFKKDIARPRGQA